MKILISAAEVSSDQHGAELLRALREEAGAEKVEAFGVGGPRLQHEGLRPVIDARELLAMGFGEIVTRLPRIFRGLRELQAAAELERPDVAVVIDYPDFHFRLARRLKRLGVPIVYYIPPKVWAWRKGRVGFLRDFFARVLCILPFEMDFYAREKVPARYVGNPLVDELPLGLTRAEARAGLGIAAADLMLVAMPGSRPSEIRHHVELMLESALKLAARMRAAGKLDADTALRVFLPFSGATSIEPIRAQVDAWVEKRRKGNLKFPIRPRVSQGDAHACLVAADVGLIKSGTSTLEAGLLGCPHIITYRPGFLSRWIFRHLVRYRGPIGLVNLVAHGGPEARAPFLIPEIISDAATPESLSEGLAELLTDQARRRSIAEGLARLRSLILQGAEEGSPSRRAAREVLACRRS